MSKFLRRLFYQNAYFSFLTFWVAFFLISSFTLTAQVVIGGGDGAGCPTFGTTPVFTVNSGQQNFDLFFTVTGGRDNPVTVNSFSTTPSLPWMSMTTTATSSGVTVHLKGDAPTTNKSLFYPASIKVSTATCARTMGFTLVVQPQAMNPVTAGIIFVSPTGAGNFSGVSWTNATNDLQAAINAASASARVYVKGGVYAPVRRADNLAQITPNDPNNAFVLKKDVRVVGGFTGSGYTTGDSSILSGNFGAANDISDNAFHVVLSVGDAGNGELKRFTIKDGNASGGQTITVNGVAVPQGRGSGMFIAGSSLGIDSVLVENNIASQSGGGLYIKGSAGILSNITVSSNTASEGGGLYLEQASPFIFNAVVSGNYAQSNGGGIYDFSNASPVMTNVVITGNKAENIGAAILNNVSASPVITNATITGNYGPLGGDGIYNLNSSTPTLRNSIIYDQYDPILNYDASSKTTISSCMITNTFGVSTGDIQASDPLFVNEVSRLTAPFAGGNYHLQSMSPLINRGNRSFFNAGQSPDLSIVTTDIDGNPRVLGGAIELGAYEVPGVALPVKMGPLTGKIERNKRTTLLWTTFSETNNKGFQVQLSTDGDRFQDAVFVSSKALNGNSHSSIPYKVEMETLSGTVFYRLKQNDRDGHASFSNVVALTSPFPDVNVYPNPAHQFLHFSITQAGPLSIFNSQGILVMRIALKAGDNVVSIGQLSAGVYFGKINGQQIQFIKQ